MRDPSKPPLTVALESHGNAVTIILNCRDAYHAIELVDGLAQDIDAGHITLKLEGGRRVDKATVSEPAVEVLPLEDTLALCEELALNLAEYIETEEIEAYVDAPDVLRCLAVEFAKIRSSHDPRS
jgi:hypothetical protein